MGEKKFMKRIVHFSLGVAALMHSLGSIAAESGDFSKSQICRATIGAIMGRDPKIIKMDKAEADVIHVSYIRANDGTAWNQRCRIQGMKVIWATETGRWRDDPLDEVISYTVTPTTLTIRQKFSDGSSSAQSYTRAQLGRN